MFKKLVVATLILLTCVSVTNQVSATTITEFYQHYNEPLDGEYVTDTHHLDDLIKRYETEQVEVSKEIEHIETFNEVIGLSQKETKEFQDKYSIYSKIQNSVNELYEIDNPTPRFLIEKDNQIKTLMFKMNAIEEPLYKPAELSSLMQVEKLNNVSSGIELAKEEKEQLLQDSQITPFSLPLTKYQLFDNPEDFRITSTMSPRIHPIKGTLEVHSGVDFGGPEGSNVRFPFRKGTIITNSYDPVQGNHIVIFIEPSITIHFLHFKELPKWKIGDSIVLNDIVGLVGTTGSSTGNHLHLTIKVNNVKKSIID